ncbi:MAG TPA: hypothetical protein VGZ02_12775 [Candidatus Baltobacteraceae bacterium]|jgi:hypothetical protein|nr:hypothetical protein [Candidatus Baltobacteraceae bacterium]
MPKKLKPRQKRKPRSERICGLPVSDRADYRVITAIGDLLRAVGRCRAQLFAGEPRTEQECVSAMLGHVYDAAASAVTGVSMLLSHGGRIAPYMMGRLCFEYMVRAEYCAAHPDYAQWALRLQFLRSNLRYNDAILSNKDKRIMGDRLRREERCLPKLSPHAREEAGLVPFHQITFTDMMLDVLDTHDPEAYRRQSMLMHADPYAIATLDEVDVAAVNRELVEACVALARIGTLIYERVTLGAIAEEEFRAACARIDDLSTVYGNLGVLDKAAS